MTCDFLLASQTKPIGPVQNFLGVDSHHEFYGRNFITTRTGSKLNSQAIVIDFPLEASTAGTLLRACPSDHWLLRA